ncbi:peptidoglycan editing factor PgeF [uncultured Dialister sp.]|uniref:peptidoglycan editing factor PgeF n=1 Tax=uncultured Dialister sp. TaxID=278064 RepID=UPI00260535CC|nr:peptidoglycan editing factor PgeF [uncultured Dialister sp.]
MILGNRIPYLSFTIYKDLPVKAAVSTRKGGVSVSPYDSLNMGLHTGDSLENVLENRKRYCHALGIDEGSLINCCQVHGTHIEEVDERDRGRGAFSLDSAIPATDGLMTSSAAVPLTMNYADCTPLFFYDPVKKVIALSHGGWRGTAGDIAGKTVSLMAEKFHSRREDILGAIGPAIGLPDFEVGEEVILAMKPLFSEEEWLSLYRKKENGKYLFGLAEANHCLMRKAGLLENHIEDCHISTWKDNDLFYSYRKEKGRTGRHMAVLMMEP